MLTNEVAKNIQFIRAEIERHNNCVSVKEPDNQLLRTDIQLLKTDIQSLREELDNLKNEKESAIQSLRADNQVLKVDLEQQKKCVLDKEADNQSLRADLENQNKDVLQKESHIQSLTAELERQGKLVERLVKELDEHRSWLKPHCTGAQFSGIYDIVIPKFSSEPFKVACDAQTRDGGWTIILRRMDGSVNFYRNWTEYKNGFGNLDGEYFLGLDKIHAMTAERRQELLVLVEDFEGDRRYETYDEFAIGNEDQQYELHTLGKANGTAGDSLSVHRGLKFTTFDKDNDYWEEENCAIQLTGAWWHNSCYHSQLTGTYKDSHIGNGVNWNTFRGSEYSLKTAIMMIRPKKTDVQSLRVDQEKQNKDVLQKDSHIQSLTAELERQGKLKGVRNYWYFWRTLREIERYETYDEFAIGNEDQQYELHTLGKANGTAGDSTLNIIEA
ncbi:hypothetical protein ACLKA6_018991 [Drosophila palustris]